MRTRIITLEVLVPDSVPDWALEEIATNSLPDTLEQGVGVVSVTVTAAAPRDCDLEFGADHDHDDAECARMLDVMSGSEGHDDGLADALNREAEESALGRPLFPNEY